MLGHHRLFWESGKFSRDRTDTFRRRKKVAAFYFYANRIIRNNSYFQGKRMFGSNGVKKAEVKKGNGTKDRSKTKRK
jgi:hypothetical protein